MESRLPERRNLPLAEIEFVITGRLDNFSRQEAEARIKALGGKAATDVTRKTKYVVVGADPGSKAARAEALGIEKLDEHQFLTKLEDAEKKLKS